MGPLATNQILVKGLNFPHVSTLTEPRGSLSLVILTTFPTFEN